MKSPLMSSNKHDLQTPREVFDPLHAEFDFTIDAAASPENAMLPRYWTIHDNALVQDWAGERVWCNPPYGPHQVAFIKKAALCLAEVSVLLIPARTDTAAWHDYILPVAEVRFIRGRITFVGANANAPFPSAIVVFRRDAEQPKHLRRIFPSESRREGGIPRR